MNHASNAWFSDIQKSRLPVKADAKYLLKRFRMYCQRAEVGLVLLRDAIAFYRLADGFVMRPWGEAALLDVRLSLIHI